MKDLNAKQTARRCSLFLLLVFLCFATTIRFSFSQEMSRDERKNLDRHIKELKDKDVSVRYEAAESLRYYPYPEAVSALSQALKDPSESVRNMAALSLYELKEDARSAIPALQQALQDSDPITRINVGATLLNLGVDEKMVIPAVKQLLQHPEPRPQVEAARFLQGNVPFPELMPVLTSALKNQDADIRIDASKVFDDAKELPTDALPVLVGALKDPNAEVRKNAASALRNFKTKGTAALPALLQALKDSDHSVRIEAVDAITSMGTWAMEALPALGEVIQKDPDAGVRKMAVRSLEWIDPEGKNAMPFLLEALKDKDAEVRAKSLETMLSFRPFPFQSVPAVQAALASETDANVKIRLQSVIERGEREKSYAASNRKDTPLSIESSPKKTSSGMPKAEAIRMLQEQGIQMTTDEFWRYVNSGDAPVVRAMLSAGVTPNSEQQGMSILMAAVRSYDETPEQKEVIQSLIDFGADVNYRDQNDTTPFFYAAGKCEPDLLLSMIKAGAILEIHAKGGATTLSEAVMANRVENVAFLLKSGYKLKSEPPWLLATAKNPEIAALLRKAGLR